MNPSELSQGLVSYIDSHHPRLGSKLMKLRWGGLRTIEPDRLLGLSVVTVALGTATTVRHLAGRRPDRRPRVGYAPVLPVATALTWIGVWRWDAARWRRTHVMVVVDLTSDRLDDLVDELVAQGLDVQRWDGPRRADGARHGISCRLRELRRVNAAIDAAGRHSVAGWS